MFGVNINTKCVNIVKYLEQWQENDEHSINVNSLEETSGGRGWFHSILLLFLSPSKGQAFLSSLDLQEEST